MDLTDEFGKLSFSEPYVVTTLDRRFVDTTCDENGLFRCVNQNLIACRAISADTMLGYYVGVPIHNLTESERLCDQYHLALTERPPWFPERDWYQAAHGQHSVLIQPTQTFFSQFVHLNFSDNPTQVNVVVCGDGSVITTRDVSEGQSLLWYYGNSYSPANNLSQTLSALEFYERFKHDIFQVSEPSHQGPF